MNAFTDLFIRRPVLATVVSLLILLIGAMAGFKLQIRQFPQTSNTTITITTTYPGAAADVIKGFITTPIEQAVASAEGIDTLVSTSQQNVSTITLNLRLDANPDRAMADTLSKVNQVRGLLAARGQRSGRRQADRAGLRPHVPVVQFERDDGLADHRLSDPRRAAAAADRRRRRQRANSRRPDFRDAHLAQSDENGGARRHRRTTSARRSPPTTSPPPPARSKATTPKSASTR